tara:strand:+ start:249 stop:710 length:462 start_codon:yes stop_codon:yes gene_type:complete
MTTHELPFSSLQLRFTLHTDAPAIQQQGFAQLRHLCQSPEHVPILHAWVEQLNAHNIGFAVDRQVLDICEGGIGGSDKKCNRQMRFCAFRNVHALKPLDDINDIKLVALDSGNHTEVWSIADVMEFGRALRQVFLDCLMISDNCLNMFVTIQD